ncbi:MAG: hypothetical protein F4086_18120 [Gemmatimonadetes bacterium]|nr:hypothetical protein [Dehalococcoidia bacterium]MYJ12225.1 hypothetical protein [Gemmatimonadota bacterium]
MLTRLCANATSLVIAAPYIKADALSRALGAANTEASLTCVTRWSLQDLAVGASDAECRNVATDFGGSFRLHPSLHAKYYRFDDVVLIGSANLTASAMGWSRQPNLEILCRAGDDFDSLAFEQELLEKARELSDDEFLRWEAIAKVAARRELDLPGKQPELDTWRPRTRDPIHLELSYAGRGDEIASFDEQRAAQHDVQTLLLPPNLTSEEVRLWATACLLAAPFTNSVIQLGRTTDAPASYQSLAGMYGLSMTEARRAMETVRNWLAFLAPGTLD